MKFLKYLSLTIISVYVLVFLIATVKYPERLLGINVPMTAAVSGADSGLVIAINAGGPGVTVSGVTYSADQYNNGGDTYITTNAIAGTVDDALYQSERSMDGNLSYSIPVANGNYDVTLKFAEIYYNTSGARLFNVNIENQNVATNLDLVAQVGVNTAYDLNRTVAVTDGQLNIDLIDTGIDDPKISAILVMSTGGTSSTATLTVNPAGTGSGTVTGTGINCGSDCSETVNIGTSITLTASPATGSTFTGWSGGGCSGTGNCAVILNANTTVTATFTSTAVSGCSTTAKTCTAASVSYADVNTAVSNALDGYTVIIPSGTATWTQTLLISKSITLQGAGITSGGNLTKIIRGGSLTGDLVTIRPSSDVPVRVTGIYFDNVVQDVGDRPAIGVEGPYGQGWGLTQIRIDNCKINFGTRQIYWAGWAYGLIDHCEFVNGYISIYIEGDGDAAWTRSIVPGTGNAVFIEDNTFTMNNSVYTTDTDGWIYHYDGGRSVIRNNTFDGLAFTKGDLQFFDSHGNQNYYGQGDRSRGQPMIEVYNNIFKTYKSYRLMNIRSGSLLIHDNAFTVSAGTSAPISLTEEEGWQTQFFSPLRTTWPAQDQINNTFIWNNTYNSSPLTINHVSNTWNPKDNTFIQENRDFWMKRPDATTITNYPQVTNYPSSPVYPMRYTTIISYTPFVYPHPLTGVTPPVDTTSPVITLVSPTSPLAIGTTQSVLSISTNEASACRYSKIAGTGYGSMTSTLNAGTGSLTHTSTVTGLTAGDNPIYVRCSDTAGNVNTSDFTATINVHAPDTTLPTVSITAPANNATVSGSAPISASATDNVAIASVQFKLDGNNIDPLITVAPYSGTWNTIGISNGTHTLTAVATDTSGNTKTSNPITITINNTISNTPPTLTTIGNKTIAEGSNLTFTVLGTDVDGDPLTYSATGLPTGATFTAGTRTFNFTPSYTQAGSYTVTFTVNDGRGGTDSKTSIITVTNTNRAPIANAGPDQNITLPATASLSAALSSDPDGQTLTYTWSKVSGPGTVIFTNPNTVSTIATFSTSGAYILRVSVSDGTLSATDQVAIGVNQSLPLDSDNDGVIDPLDLCPNTPATLTSQVNTRGCPKPKATKFILSPSPDNIDLNSVSALEIATIYGKISYNVPVSLVRDAGTYKTQLDLDANINIDQGSVNLDSVNLPELNKAATITLYNLTSIKPRIFKGAAICDQCRIISYRGGTLVFTVSGFSRYIILEETTIPTCTYNNPAWSNCSGSSQNRTLSATNQPCTGEITKVETQKCTTSRSGGGGGGGGGGSSSSGRITPAVTQAPNTISICQFIDLLITIEAIAPAKAPLARAAFSCTGTSLPVTYIPPYTPTNTATSLITIDLYPEMRHPQVITLKNFLTQRGYLTDIAGTNYYGPLTTAAVQAFQRANNIVSSGTPATTGYGAVGPKTREVINGK